MTIEASTPESPSSGGSKWPTILVLAILIATTVFNVYWVWGLLFIYWAIGGIRTNEMFIVQPLSRADNPGLFWFACVSWVGIGLWMIVGDILYRLG